MLRPPPSSTRTYTLFPYTTLVRLVIDGKGDLSSALMGTSMMNACRQLGIAGVVIDGAARDSLDIIEMDYPVFAAGTNPNGPTKNIGGRIGHPVTVGGVTVHPGDRKSTRLNSSH